MIKTNTTKLLWQSDLMATRFTLAIAAIMTGLMLVFKPEYWPMDGVHIVAALFVLQGGLMSYFGLGERLVKCY